MHSFYHNEVNIHYNSDYSGLIMVDSPGKGEVEVPFPELLEAAFDEDQKRWNNREIDAIEKFVGSAAIMTEIERLEQLPTERALEDSNLVWGLNEMVKKLTS
jgi:hypothetical protein